MANTAKTPVVNYTAEQTAMIVAAFTAAPVRATVEALATKLGKSAASITAKLVRENAYVKPTYTTKTGDTPVRKSELVDSIGKKVPLTGTEMASFEHVNKTALKKLVSALAGMPDLEDGDIPE